MGRASQLSFKQLLISEIGSLQMTPCKVIHALWSLWRLMCLGSIANFTATRLVRNGSLQNGILWFGSTCNSYSLQFPFSRWDRSLDQHEFICRVKHCWFRGSTSARLWLDCSKIRAYWINLNQPSCTWNWCIHSCFNNLQEKPIPGWFCTHVSLSQAR